MIQYLGSKRALLPQILHAVGAAAGEHATVADLFSGSARVAHALKACGWRVLANDHATYAHALAAGMVQADAERWAAPAARILAELDRLPPRPGWFTATYAERARYLHPRNAARLEAAREAVAAMGAEPELEAVLLAALVIAADRVDSTTGTQMAFLKDWSPRALRPLRLRLPPLLPRPAAGACLALRRDAEALAAEVEAEVAYLDPPYNRHCYRRSYHVWETLVRWDRPEVRGIACRRIDAGGEGRSAFNSPRRIGPALFATVAALRCPTLVVSFGEEGHLPRATLEALLAGRGHLQVIALPHARYAAGGAARHRSIKGRTITDGNGPGQRCSEAIGTPRRATTEFLYVASRRRLDLGGMPPRAA